MNRTLAHSTPNLSTHGKGQSLFMDQLQERRPVLMQPTFLCFTVEELKPGSRSRFSQPDEILTPLVLHQHSEGSSSSPRASVRAWFPLIRKALLQPTKSPLQKCLLSNIYVPTFFPQRKAWQPTPLFLSGESHGQRSLVGYSPYGCKEVWPDWSDLACPPSFFISRVGEGIKSLLFMWRFDRKQQNSIKQLSFN